MAYATHRHAQSEVPAAELSEIASLVLPRERGSLQSHRWLGSLAREKHLNFRTFLCFPRPIVRYLPSKGKVQLALRASES